jgi:hypothetical protein
MSPKDGRNQNQIYPEADQPGRQDNLNKPGGEGANPNEKPSEWENPAEPQDGDDERIEEDLPEKGDQKQPRPIE